MSTLFRDLRHAISSMRRSPGFSLATILTLALGIGGATTMFSLAYGVLVRGLPYADADRLVRLWEEHPGAVSPAGNRWLSSHTHAAWQDRAATLEAIGGYSAVELTATFDEGMKMSAARVSPEIFTMLAVTPARGRFFSASDVLPGAEPVVVLSDGLWRERYAGDPEAVGRLLIVDEVPHRIVGVAKPGLAFPERGVRFWVPYVLREATGDQGTRVFSALGRLRPGVTPAQAAAEGTIAARSARRGPLTDFFFGRGGTVVVHARRLQEDLTQPVRPALSVLAAASALVLLIACANVTTLVLSRGVARQRELAVRAALGGTRVRLVRQLLTEYGVLIAAGGALALLVSWWLFRLVPVLAPPGMPRMDEVGLDAAAVAYCLLATLVAALASAAFPAVRAVSARYDALREHDTSSAAAGAPRVRNTLLAAEAAFAGILVVGASLLGHSFARLLQVDVGYTAEGVLTAFVELPGRSPDSRVVRFVDTVVPELTALPGVTAAGAADMIPLMKPTAVGEVTLPDWIAGGKPARSRVRVYTVTPGYAAAIGLRLKEGRFVGARDAGSGRRPMVVNEEFVRQHVSVRPVVGLVIHGLTGPQDRFDTEIVGVVGNVLKEGSAGAPLPELYYLHGAGGRAIDGGVKLVMRTTGDPSALAPELRRIIRRIEPAAVVDPIAPLQTAAAASRARPRFATAIVGAFAGIALVLAAIGLYGVLSYGVSRRRRELGVRAALGASRGRLIGAVLREGLSWTLFGLSIGVLTAGGLAHLSRALLFGVAPLDPLAFTVGPLMLIAIAAAACIVPARRAASTDPAITLRGD